MDSAEVEDTLPDTVPGDLPGSEVPTPVSEAQSLGCDPPSEGLGPSLPSGVEGGTVPPTEPSEKDGNHSQNDQNGDSTKPTLVPPPEIGAKPIPSPCRASLVEPVEVPETPSSSSVNTPTSEDSLGDIPYEGDANAKQPDPGLLRLSQAAINQRMDRVFKPSKKTGNYKVSNEILSMFRSKHGKLKLQQIFQSCGYDPDSGF